MRKEVSDWVESAKNDLETATTLLREKVFYASAFYSQQAAEKALKAAYISKSKKLYAQHNIISLATELGATSEIIASCKRLNPHYIQSRYPDAANAVPADSYDNKIASELLIESKKVVEWAIKKATS